MQLSSTKNFDQKTRFKSIFCNNNATDYMKFHVCKVKVTRYNSSLEISVNMIKPLVAPLNVHVIILYKYGQIYRQILSVPQIEACWVMKNLNEAHPIIKSSFEVLGESIKPFLKGCPYFGTYNVSLFCDPLQIPSLLPSGM